MTVRLVFPAAVEISAFSGGKAPYTWAATGLRLASRFASEMRRPSRPATPRHFWVAASIGTFTVHVTMTDADGIAVSNDFPLRISRLLIPEFLQSGTIGQPYAAHVRVIGGTLPYNAAIIDGALPAEYRSMRERSNLSGIPLENGSFRIVLRISDAGGNTLTKVSRWLFIGGDTSTVNISSSTIWAWR